MKRKEFALELVKLQDAGQIYLTEEGFEALILLVKEEYFTDSDEMLEDVG